MLDCPYSPTYAPTHPPIKGVDPHFLHPLPMNEETTLCPQTHLRVTLLDANHCPGACLLLFKVPSETGYVPPTHPPNLPHPKQSTHPSNYHREKTYLHCGDMRFHPRMLSYPALQAVKIDTVFLDTTYSHPR